MAPWRPWRRSASEVKIALQVRMGGKERGRGLPGTWATSLAGAMWERELELWRRLAMSVPNLEMLMLPTVLERP